MQLVVTCGYENGGESSPRALHQPAVFPPWTQSLILALKFSSMKSKLRINEASENECEFRDIVS